MNFFKHFKKIPGSSVFLLFLYLLVCGCSEENPGELILVEKDESRGFNYPYFLFIPEKATDEKNYLVVEPNNSGFANDTLELHIEKARRTAGKDFYIGSYVAQKLNYPLLVPVFPRSRTTWKIYTHSLDRDAMDQKENSLERIDLQLLQMIEDAENRLQVKGIEIQEEFLMTGFSASGVFANRFTLLHPKRVKAMAAGGVNGLLMIPRKEVNGQELNYPLGINDYEDRFDRKFDSTAFKDTPQFLFMGELDENDAIPYDDAYDMDEREVIYASLGKEMQPMRWNNSRKLYEQEGVDAMIKTYEGVGHEQAEEIKKDIVDFFRQVVKE